MIEALSETMSDRFVLPFDGPLDLPTTLATIEVLPEVAAAVQGKVEVFLDGGIRRGTDVVKAIALSPFLARKGVIKPTTGDTPVPPAKGLRPSALPTRHTE